MTKLDEIIKTYYENNEPITSSDLFDLQSVKDIAIAYAKLCLDKAAEEAKIYFADEDWQWNTSKIKVSKKSITDIKLP